MCVCRPGIAGEREAILLEEFVYLSAPFPSCHAVSLVETAEGTLMATWFGGPHEQHRRVGIWTSRHLDGRWTPPVEVANGLQDDGNYQPCWNPVLFQPRNGPLLLFFKVGPNPAQWWGEMMVSEDGGRTWKERKRIPGKGIGPVRCKPIETADGRILCPSSDEANGDWISHVEVTDARGENWQRGRALHDTEEAGTIQPTLMPLKNGHILIFCRDRNSNGCFWQCLSDKRNALRRTMIEQEIIDAFGRKLEPTTINSLLKFIGSIAP